MLVPGAGLGRLAYEIAHRGFECQGNEFSLFMLFGSNYILNRCKGLDSVKIHPYIHQFTNVASVDDATAEVAFPDADPNDLPEDSKFSMAAGDFLEVYADPEYENSQDVVVTCFFIDCAHNILDFIQLINKVKKTAPKIRDLFFSTYFHFSV